MNNRSRIRIHIIGASGTGTTTLGRALAYAHQLQHFDTDDYLWVESDPPYQQIRPKEERLQRLEADLRQGDRWVLSGSLSGWGDPLRAFFDLVVFLYVPTGVRLERLRRRETERFGLQELLPGGRMHQNHTEFMQWASRYDEADESTRSLRLHRQWLETLQCPVLRLEGERSIDEQVERVTDQLRNIE
jgi:adenylate kinase family enzyme